MTTPTKHSLPATQENLPKFSGAWGKVCPKPRLGGRCWTKNNLEDSGYRLKGVGGPFQHMSLLNAVASLMNMLKQQRYWHVSKRVAEAFHVSCLFSCQGTYVVAPTIRTASAAVDANAAKRGLIIHIVIAWKI